MNKAFEIIMGLELELAQPAVRKDSGRLDALLADEFEEVGKSGKVYSKPEIINSTAVEMPGEIRFTGFRFKALSKHTVLVRYKSFCNGINANRSSLWIKQNGRWRMLYHQGTEFK